MRLICLFASLTFKNNTMIKMIHHFIPFLLYVVLLISIVRAALNKIENPKKDKFLTLSLIFAHVQLLIGIVALIPFLSNGVDMANAASRFLIVEHPLSMILGVVVLTIGKVKAKKIEDVAKANKTILIYFIIAIVLFAIRTPWDKLFA